MHVFVSENHQRHSALELSRGQLRPSVESPQRVNIVTRSLEQAGHSFHTPKALDQALLRSVHTSEYIEFLSTAWERWATQYGTESPAMAFAWPSRNVTPSRPDNLTGQLGYHSFAADCSIVAGTWNAATEAAAIAQSAADQVIQGASSAYALARPPGHHATADQFGGYCYLNNSAIAAQRLLHNNFTKVAILDIDYHHGNGTQDIFYHRDDVLTVSIHADPAFEFPWFAGHANETGEGIGDGWNVNLPLAKGANLTTWRTAIGGALERIQTVGVEALVVAFGVDTYVDDPLGTFAIETVDYTTIGTDIYKTNLPTVIVQEGGYAIDAIGDNVAAFLKPFD